jgi:hypothetical protein
MPFLKQFFNSIEEPEPQEAHHSFAEAGAASKFIFIFYFCAIYVKGK